MKLEPQLDKIREGFEKKAPPDILEIMHEATNNLRRSGLVERALKEGQTAPNFELQDSHGRLVDLATLREQGPVVLTFFRGHW